MEKYETYLGSWLTRPELAVVEVMAKSGHFKWLTVDIEHTTIGIHQVEEMIRVIQLSGLEAFVRISENDTTLIKRVLDAGADGIIVPMVNNASDITNAIKSAFYPTRGIRGVGLARAQNYGTKFHEYKDNKQKKTKIIIQIEHIEAVNNIENLFQKKEIFGYFIGPYDLSASLGKPGEFDDEEVVSALKKVKKAGEEYNVRAGIHIIEPNSEEVQQRISEGYSIIAVSFDMMFLHRGIDLAFK